MLHSNEAMTTPLLVVILVLVVFCVAAEPLFHEILKWFLF
jgi:hypothetical protein